jgi:hypothetical protein
MTKQPHPITPPPELVAKWAGSMCGYYEAARWGADQELEACVELLSDLGGDGAMVRRYRRPKPPSLKEQALLVIDTAVNDYRMSPDAASIIRRALEALDD